MSVIIRMKNLPITAGAADVRTFFSGLKIPDGAVHIIGGDEGEVFVGFASDEDARIAMTKQGQSIHTAEIQLLLSSKSEQNSVISARKNGIFSSPAPVEEFPPPAPASQIWPQPTLNPFGTRTGYESTYPLQVAPVPFQSYSNRPENPKPPVLTSPKKEETPREEYTYKEEPMEEYGFKEPPREEYGYKEAAPREEYGYKETPREEFGYKANFQSAPPNRFGPGAPRGPEPPKPAAHMPKIPPMHQQPPPSQTAPTNNFGFRGNNHGPPGGHQGPPNGRMSQGGDSWRDSNYSNSKNDFGGNKFNNRNEPPHQVSRKQPMLPTPPSSQFQPPQNNGPYQNGPPNQNGRPFVGPPNGPSQNGPNGAVAPFPNRNGPPPFQNSQQVIGGPVPPIAMNRNQSIPPQFQNAPRPTPNVPMKPVIPPVIASRGSAPTGEKFYIELTRLPTELIRPAALEAFIRPSVPLSISSVKTAFGPGGIHINTIVRLDSIADYAMMSRRNGEQGIKIQQSNAKEFDAIVEALPTPSVPSSGNKKDDDSASRRKSRWSDKSPLKERVSPRRGGNRSRSPIRKRRRSRSPRRREEHTDPTRWCIQITNVPFRMKDEELIEWFSEKVRPAKLSRTYYSDGNASDRWVAEFSSESLMRRAFGIRTLCQGRTLKLSYIDNEKADEILKIEDVYGKEKRQINEEARMLQEEAEKANPPSFFNQPSVIPRGPPSMGPNSFNGPPNGMPSMNNNMNGMAPMNNNPNGPPPMRGGFAARGNAFAPRGGMMGAPPPTGRGPQGPSGPGAPFYQNGPPGGFNNPGPDNFRGGYHGNGGFRGGRGGGRGGFKGGFRDDHHSNEMKDLIQSLGPQGTVLSCTGIPTDVTLEDVASFFGRYEPDRNSIRIRRGDSGIPTGECMLACYNANDARQAAQDLDGQRWHNMVISVRQI